MIRRALLGTMTLIAGLVAGCGSTPNIGSTQDREMLTQNARAVLTDFKNADPSLQAVLDRSRAYAVYPEVVTGAIVFGGAYGHGEVFRGNELIGYSDISQGSFGAQLGGQKYAELIVFLNEAALVNFQQGTFEFDARATAVAASNGAAASADYSRGVVVFTLPLGGLMAQAAVGGQKFRYVPVGQ